MANKDVNIQIRAIDKTKKGFASATRGLKMIAGAALNMKTALVGAAGVAGMGLLISRSLSATDALSKTATRIGTTTESLSRLQYAAKISGVETQTLNMAMQRFGRRASEAAVGTGEARGALKELRLNAADLIKLPLDEQMIKLAQAFEDNIDPIDRTRIAMKLFDSEGVALLQMTELGAAGMRELFKEAEMLGAVMSQDAAKGVEDANDAMTKLFTIFKGVTAQITAALAPALEAVVTHLKDLLVDAAAAEGGFKKLAQNMAASMLGAFGAVIQGSEDMINTVIGGINTVNAAAAKISLKLGVGDRAKLAGLALEYKDLQGAVSAYGKERAAMEMRAKSVGGVAPLDPAMEKNFAAVVERMKKIRADFKALNSESFLGNDIAEVDFAGGVLAKLDELKAKLLIPMVVATPTLTDPAPIISPWTQAMEALNKGFANVDVDTLQQKMDKFANTTVKNMSAGLMSIVEGTASLKDAFKSMVKSLIMQAIQLFVIDKLTGGFISFMKNMTGGGGGGGGGGLTGKAIGGPVQAGQPYMVGERGPEMFIPNQGGSIASNKKMGGGGITVVNNVDARGSGADVDQKIKSAMAQSSQQTIMTIQDLMRRRRFA